MKKLLKSKTTSLLFMCLFLPICIYTIISLYKIIITTAPDYNVLYLASKDLLTNQNPYKNPQLFTAVSYPPSTLLLYLPLTIFPYKISQALFIAISFASIIFITLISLKISFNKIKSNYLMIALSLIFISFPTKFTLGMGQNNTIVLLLILFSFYLYTKGDKILPGIMLGLAISLKPIILFLLLFFLLKHRFRLILSTSLTILLIGLAVHTISHFNIWTYWFKFELLPLFNLLGREVYYNQGFMGFIARLSPKSSIRSISESIFASAIIIYLAIINFYVKKNEKIVFSLFLISLLLIDSRAWQHHFTWLIPSFVFIYPYVKQKLHFIILIISYALISINIKNPDSFLSFPSNLLLSHQFYGATVLLFLYTIILFKNRLYDK